MAAKGPALADIFDRAATAPTATLPKGEPGTTWQPTGIEAADVALFVELSSKIAGLERDRDGFRESVRAFAESELKRTIGETGKLPPMPIKIVGLNGTAVSFVVQDRTKTTALRTDQQAVIASYAADPFVEERSFRFDAATLAEKTADGSTTVLEALAGPISKAATTLCRKGVISEDQLGRLIKAEVKTTLKPGFLGRLGTYCAGSINAVEELLAAIGAGCTRFLKPE